MSSVVGDGSWDLDQEQPRLARVKLQSAELPGFLALTPANLAFLGCFRRRGSPTSPSSRRPPRRWWTTWWLPTPLMMILGLRPDRAEPAARVRSFRMQGQAVLGGTVAEAEWAVAWGSWEARGGQVVVSLGGGHHSDPQPMPDRTTS